MKVIPHQFTLIWNDKNFSMLIQKFFFAFNARFAVVSHTHFFSPSFFKSLFVSLAVCENNSHSLYKINETVLKKKKTKIKILCEAHNAASDML